MDSSSFNLEKKINEFLENFNQNASSAIDDDLCHFNGGLIRSRSKFTMDDGLEMTGNSFNRMTLDLVSISATKASKAPLFSIPLRRIRLVLCHKKISERRRKMRNSVELT